MAFTYRDSTTPCCFLIVGTGVDSGKDVLIQTDWDWPGVASRMGWVPCSKCRETDGTINCKHRTASEMIAEAGEWIREHDGEEFEGLNDYFMED